MSEKEWIDIFGDNLADMLFDARMTQRELADAVGVSESTISDYINKRSAPKVRVIVNIAHAMSCGVDELMDFEEMIE